MKRDENEFHESERSAAAEEEEGAYAANNKEQFFRAVRGSTRRDKRIRREIAAINGLVTLTFRSSPNALNSAPG